MHTPAHVIFASAAFARPGAPVRNAAAAIGGLLPDMSLFVMVGWQRLAVGRSWDQIFKEDYGAPFWQSVFAVDNSIPLWGALLAAALLFRRDWIAVLAASALLHLAFDLPLHHNDARPHFWPLSNWVFESPVSYWDPAHYGRIVAPLELIACVVLTIVLWRRFAGGAARALSAGGLALQIAPFFVFRLVFG